MSVDVLNRFRTEQGALLQEIQQRTAGKALHSTVEQLQSDWGKLHNDSPIEEIMDLLQRTQRVEMIDAAGQQDNEELLALIEELAPTTWKDTPALPYLRKQKAVGEQLMRSVELQEGDELFLNSSAPGRGVTEAIAEHCIREGIFFRLDVLDADFTRLLVGACNPEQAAAAGKARGTRRTASSKLLFVVQEYPVSPDVEVAVPRSTVQDAFKTYGAEVAAARKNTQSRDLRYCLTFIPTPDEAAHDDMDYDAYLKLFFELCNQPWDHIQAAQANLIGAFNQCEGFHAENEDGTDVRMSIKDFQFANSVVARNLPGSEIFSAPELDSVNGRVVAKGKFKAPGSTDIIEDMEFTFKDGWIVDHDARVNKAALTKFLERHPENMRVGELGIGTNPWLTRHVTNGLLVEKINGSFHLALGHCYKNGYLGEEVRMDNGNNDSPDHWDMTTMLKGREGKMYLTDAQGVEHLVQDNGEWLAVPELGLEQKHMDILNKGWEAVRAQEGDAKVPAEWRKILDAHKERER